MKPSSFFRKTGAFVFSACFAAAVSACGNLNVGHTASVSQYNVSGDGLPPSSTSGATVSSGLLTQGKYSCPSSVVPNVKPYDYASSTSGNFQVCVDQNSQNDVLVNGDEGGDTVCLFPMTSGSWIPDQSNLPTYSCGSSSSSGIVYNFQNTWNSAAIVAGKDAGAMQICLTYGPGSQYCQKFPNFSYGIFR